MPWGRLDDKANGDDKLLALSNAGWRMWGCGLIYCQDKLTDGFVPDYVIHTFGVREVSALEVAEELCRSLVPGKGPLWHKVDGGYQVHDYLDWNDSRAKILRERAQGKARLDRYRERLARNAALNTEQNGERNAVSRGVSNSVVVGSGDAGVTENAVSDGAQNSERPLSGVENAVSNAPIHVPRTTKEEVHTHGGGRTTGGAGAGTLPRDHFGHAWCGNYRKCVPDFLHAEFVAGLGGDETVAKERLKDFYEQTMAGIPDDQPIAQDAPKFWRPRFARAFGSPTLPTKQPTGSLRTAGNFAALQGFASRRKTL